VENERRLIGGCCLQLKEIKDKKIRQFYEDQNERLNDWLEVDTLVRHVAVRIMSPNKEPVLRDMY